MYVSKQDLLLGAAMASSMSSYRSLPKVYVVILPSPTDDGARLGDRERLRGLPAAAVGVAQGQGDPEERSGRPKSDEERPGGSPVREHGSDDGFRRVSPRASI